MQPQMQQPPQRGKWLTRARIVGFIIALLLLLIGGILLISGFQAPLLSTIFTVLGVVIGLFQLYPLFFPPKQEPIPAYTPPPVAPALPPINIHLPAYPPIPAVPANPTTPALQVPTSTDMYMGTRATPPPTDPRTIQQREPVVKDVYAQLTRPDTTAVVLTGIGGMGKSTLAALVYKYAEAQRIAGKGAFQAEAVWLRVEENTTLGGLAGNLFAAVGKPQPNLEQLTPANQAFALANLLNSVAASRLIVLDQFENFLNWETGHALPEHLGVGELLDALNSQACRCRVLLTSRPRPKGTRAAPQTSLQVYPVGGLTLAEGVALLRNRGVTGSEVELQTAVQHCDGHGLALELLVSLISEQKLSLSALLKDDRLWDGDIATNLLDAIYQKQLSNVQRQLLQAFSVYREAVPQEAVQGLLAESAQGQILPALRALLIQSLLQAAGEGRYQLHPIVDRYAHRHFVENDEHANQQAVQAAHAKAAQYYLEQAKTSCPPREKRQGVKDVAPLIEAVWQWCQAGQWQTAYELMNQEFLFTDLHRWGGNVILLDLCQQLLTGQWQPEPRQAAAHIRNDLALAYDNLGQKQEALRYYEEALRIFGEVGDRGGEGVTLHNIGTMYVEQKRYDIALACFLLAKGLFEQVQSPYKSSEEQWIDSVRKSMGEQQFAALLGRVEAQAQQIVDAALGELA
jgi:tetratricopeptide (TPR) repeat protein